MSRSAFYADLDEINGKGVFVTGHGKGLVSKNQIINGKCIANDMVRLVVKQGKLFGYQGYIEKEDNELTKIDYLLYFYEKSEPEQPFKPTIITVETYLQLSKHNIDIGGVLGARFGRSRNAYSEYEEILKQTKEACFISIAYTADESDRATFVNNIII
jgi:hypothetical protein